MMLLGEFSNRGLDQDGTVIGTGLGQEVVLTFAFEEGSAKAFVRQGSSELERICLALDRQKDSAECWVISYRVRWRAIQNK